MCNECKILPFGSWKFKKKKNIAYTTIDKLPSVDSLECFFTKFNNLSIMPHLLLLLLLSRNYADR